MASGANLIHLICDKCYKPLPYVDITTPVEYAARRGFRDGAISGALAGAGLMWLIHWMLA